MPVCRVAWPHLFVILLRADSVFLYLSELQSSLLPMVLILGCSLVLPLVLNKEKTWVRTLLGAVSIALALRYIWWRATQTIAPLGLTVECLASWALLALEGAAMVGTISATVMNMRTRNRSDEATNYRDWWGDASRQPRVALLIATYNEEMDVLERTIVGAQFLEHANKEVIVLDDGKRDWLRDYCAQRGVRYICRPINEGAKAGNLNHALSQLAQDATPPEFVAVLDADFVPHRGFLSRGLALFHDPKVGLVQTPQHFFNPDPIQHNLGLHRSYPDEQRYFFDYAQASRDAWGIAFCCGTSSIARWQALQEIRGFPTESITEDFMLTLVLRNAGWSSVYLNEALSEGLAPEGLKEYITQRARWCIGMMQIARSYVGPFARNNLRLRDRWSVLDSGTYWLTTFPFRLAALIFPLLYWYFNITVVNARLAEVLSYFGAYYMWTMLVSQILSKGMLIPFVQDVTQLVAAPQITRAAVSGLFRPKGHKFTVTAKGGDRTRIVYQWRFMWPFALLMVLTVVGLWLGVVSDRFAHFDAGDGKQVILFWTFYNLVVLVLATIACVELPRTEYHVADHPERTRFVATDGTEQTVWVSRLTGDLAEVRGGSFKIGTRGALELAGVGTVECYAIGFSRLITRLQIVPTEAQREALIVKFYTESNIPGVSRGDASLILSDIADRLLKVIFR